MFELFYSQKFQGARRTLCFLFQGALPKIGVPRATAYVEHCNSVEDGTV